MRAGIAQAGGASDSIDMAAELPVILAVDDDPEVLSAIVRDLRTRYREAYRIMRAASGESALETVIELQREGRRIALLLVDQRMPGLSGTDFLLEARKYAPTARRVLLTAYADTDAAIRAINEVELDHYLLKPWEPPADRLYPVLDDLLERWRERAGPVRSGLRLAGTRTSPESFQIRDFLAANHIPYRWIDLDVEADERALAETVVPGLEKLPIVWFEDGTHLIQPDHTALASRLDMTTRAARDFYDLVIVGGGPAGLAAAVYAASEGLRTVVVERNATGGQAGTSSKIENYLGFPGGLTGADLAQRATAQARRFGAEVIAPQQVVGVSVRDMYRVVHLADGTELVSYAVLLAPGMSVRRLEAEGVDRLSGVGVYYGAALTEGALYRNRHVVVVGGANSAGQGATFFARHAAKVSMLVRGSGLANTMSDYLVKRIGSTANIEVCAHTEVVRASGDHRLEQVVVRDTETGAERTLDADGLFIFIGQMPHTAMVDGFVERDKQGFIVTGPDIPRVDGRPRGWHLSRDPMLLETSVPGVFAAGDARRSSGKRVAAAVGEGSATVGMIHQYLGTV